MRPPSYQVIDQNYLREPNPELHQYFAAGNFVVLTDHAGMESHKGNALLNLKRSMEIVSKYPAQVVVLKNWYQISRITQRGSKHLRPLLIDVETTRLFDSFCKQTYALDENSPSAGLAEIERKNREANQFFTERVQYAEMVLEAIKKYRGAFPTEQMKQIRLGTYFGNKELLRRMMTHIVDIAARMMRKNGYLIKRPDFAKNNYMFRWGLAGYLLSIKWLAEGGYENLPIQKLHNDIIDTTYAAYATYFDGLLSRDNKMIEIYLLTKAFLGQS